VSSLYPYFAELLAFAILLVIILRWKRIWPALRGLMDKRRETIKASIESASAAREAAETELARRKELLEEARLQSERILVTARETAAQLTAEGERRGEEEYQRLVDGAQAEIAVERARARDELTALTGALVVEAAERVVRAELDSARQHALLDEVIAVAEQDGAPA
jgi:F-type H+-transporting ATPase subunit b